MKSQQVISLTNIYPILAKARVGYFFCFNAIMIEQKNSEHNLRGLYEYCCIFTFTHCMQFF